MNEFLSLTELGKLYGVTSHNVGRWLKTLGLRTDDGKPSQRAFQDGYVTQRPSTQPGTIFYVWNTKKTTDLLDSLCYPRASADPEQRQHRPPDC